MEQELKWNKDGHTISFLLEKGNLAITGIYCPTTEECTMKDGNCVFRAFIQIYGIECNVGVVDIAPTLEFAWALMGDTEDPINDGQLWIIPVDDEIFKAWAEAQNGSGSS